MNIPNTLNINVQLRGVRKLGGLESLIDNNLRMLHLLVPISSGRIVLERQLGAAPGFHAFAHLAIPGPDIHAEVSDHTLLAAWRKLAGNLRRQFQQRITRQLLRLKGRGQCRTVSSQWTRGA